MSHSLANATILVTGGAGLIGSHIVDLLLQEPVREVRIVDNLVRGRLHNLGDAISDPRLKFIEADVRDRDAVDSAVAGCDYVFHQAAIRITLCAKEPRECIDVLVGGTFNVFESAVKHGVRKVVYASSASVYGAAEVYPTNERHHPYDNRTLYGAAKLMDEGIARHFHDQCGLPSVGLRYFNVYGPRMDVTGKYTEVLIRWLDCVDQGVPPQIHGDGSTSMDFIYVEDIARANILAMKSARVDDVYNVGSGTETTLRDLWQAVANVTGATHLSPVLMPPRGVNAVPRRLADIMAAERDLGFRAQVDLNEGLRRLIAWRKQSLTENEVAA